MTETQNIPKLRFNEFSEDWSTRQIKDILIIHYGKDYKHLNEGNIPVLGTGGVITYVNQFLYNNESVLIGRKGTINKPMYINEPFWTVDTLFYTKIKEFFIPKFVYYLFLKINWLKYNEASGVPSLSANNIYKINIKIPSIKEQEKIADFLSLIDKKIELLEKKYYLYKKFEKTMKQKIFSQTIRFKNNDNDNFPKWEKIMLNQILFERKIFAEKNMDFPHVTLSKEGISLKSEQYDRDFLVKTENKKYKITYLNDICYNPANLKFGVITINKFGSAIFSPIYVTFTIKNVNEDFLAFYLIRKDFINKVRKYEEGTVYERMAVKPKDFLKTEIFIPSLEEQEKISSFLLLINKKIDFIEKNIYFVKNFKNGILQQIFV